MPEPGFFERHEGKLMAAGMGMGCLAGIVYFILWCCIMGLVIYGGYQGVIWLQEQNQ